jgi:hypothetical protein
MSETLQLSNPANWGTPYQTSRQANPYGTSGLFFPIPPFQIPIQFESPILAISAENQDARAWWILGCRVRQLFDVSSGPLEVASVQRRVLLNRGGTLIQFPRYAPQYRLEVEIPRWHKEMSLTIWEYIGPITDTVEQSVLEQADLIRVDLLRIETKIDAL